MKNLIYLFLFSVLISCQGKLAKSISSDKAAKKGGDAFQQLVQGINDPGLKRSLEQFRKEGLEYDLNVGRIKPDQVIKTAQGYLGTKHKMGGLNKRGIDCSGLLMVSFGKHGVVLPHSSHEIARYGVLLPDRKYLIRGDLVFFVDTYNSKDLITHSGIYLGDGQFIHASASKGVMISSVDDPYYWKNKYVFGKRVFNAK
ncbi:MAG: C40 family peptidase [Flammeovirgaceae bacterium]|nr:C40 family peptidase [Flammeovirgaceae bacterium]